MPRPAVGPANIKGWLATWVLFDVHAVELP